MERFRSLVDHVRKNHAFAESRKSYPVLIYSDKLEPKPVGLINDKAIGYSDTKPSRTEQKLWSSIYWPTSEKDKPISPEMITLAEARIVSVLETMCRSENPYFNTTGIFLTNSLHYRKDFRLGPSEGPIDGINNSKAGMVTIIYKEGDKTYCHLGISTPAITGSLEPISAAQAFVHEAVHVKDALDYLIQHPQLANEELKNLAAVRNSNPNQVAETEAKAYSEGLVSYIYQRGLLFPYGKGNLSTEVLAAAHFLILGYAKDPKKYWQEFIGKYISHGIDYTVVNSSLTVYLPGIY